MSCGIVFAKFRAPGPVDDPPADLANPDFGEACESDEGEGFDKQPVIAMLVGAALAYWTLHSPMLYTLSNMITTLVHEFGHAFAGWSFGVPSVPAFDFTYGGGVTLHQEPSKIILLLIYAGFASLLVLYRRNPVSLGIIGAATAAHVFSLTTGFDEPITIAMGHGFELLFAGIFFYRALSGFADLSVVAHSFMLASTVPLIFSVTLYYTRESWCPALGRALAFEKSTHASARLG